MKNKFRYYTLAWAIMLALFNVVCFVTPTEAAGMNKFGGAFWAGYTFITIAFIGQLLCARAALKIEGLTRIFYRVPIIRISYSGLVLTLIFGSLCMVIPDLPNWVGIIVCLIVLAFTAIAVIKSTAAADFIESTDAKVRAQTSFIKSLTVAAENLLSGANDAETRTVCKKVYEAVRYSDPMSSDALAAEENCITQKFNELTEAVSDGEDSIDKIADELIKLIGNRNRKCKLLK